LALLLAFPAGPVLVAVVLGLILVVERRPKLSRRAWTGVAALVVVVAAVGLASPVGRALYDRASGIVTGSDASAQYRAADSRASIRIWKIAPVTGVGFGNTRNVLPFVFESKFRANLVGFNDTEAYLSLLGEAGLVGLAAGLLVLAAFIWPATRPVRFATVPQLNTIGVAVSYFVAGSFLLPPLWFWGGFALASARFSTQSDLFDTAVTGTKRLFRRMWFETSPSRPVRARRAFVFVLLVAVAGAISYGFSVQRSAGSLSPIRLGQVAMLTSAPHRGDATLARTDEQLWAGHHCRGHCRVSSPPRYVAGRIWEIRARWPTGSYCLVLNLASFGERKSVSQGPTKGFTGLTACNGT
jgi:O-antigen ligase